MYRCIFSTCTFFSVSFLSFPLLDECSSIYRRRTFTAFTCTYSDTAFWLHHATLNSPLSVLWCRCETHNFTLIFHKHDPDGLSYLKHFLIISLAMHRRHLTTRNSFSLITYFQTEQGLSTNNSPPHFFNTGLKLKSLH